MNQNYIKQVLDESEASSKCFYYDTYSLKDFNISMNEVKNLYGKSYLGCKTGF